MFKQLLDKLAQIMQNDSELAWVWHCNIAMSIKDEGVSPEQANRAAARCMKTLFQVDVTKFEQWKAIDKQWASESRQSPYKWTPKVGDWVKINKPSERLHPGTSWWPVMDEYHGQIVEVKEVDGESIIHDGWTLEFDWLEPVEEPSKWTPKIGDWVKIHKPVDDSHGWVDLMDKYHGQVVKVEEFDGNSIVHDEWCFMFEWLEPAEAPKQPTEGYFDDIEGCWVDEKPPFEGRKNSDTILEGYRKLGDSLVEPRQLGDLRWSVAEKRYVEISQDEIFYANRDNWAACRKVAQEVKPPDGWRWLDIGEMIRKGDKPIDRLEIHPSWVGKPCKNDKFLIRRNRFEVGEKVVHVSTAKVCTVVSVIGYYEIKTECGSVKNAWASSLAPYVEANGEVAGEVTGEAETEWVDAVWPEDWGKPARFWPNPIYPDEGTPNYVLWELGTLAGYVVAGCVGYVADAYRPWIMEVNGKISCQMHCQVRSSQREHREVTGEVTPEVTPEVKPRFSRGELVRIVCPKGLLPGETYKDPISKASFSGVSYQVYLGKDGQIIRPSTIVDGLWEVSVQVLGGYKTILLPEAMLEKVLS